MGVMKKVSLLLFPAKCPVCDKVFEKSLKEQETHPEKHNICPRCARKLKWVKEPFCKICGKPLEETEQHCCSDCEDKRHSFTEVRSLWQYEGEAKALIERLKYANRRDYGAFIGQEMARVYGEYLKRREVEVIVPIPLSKKRMRQREYNQAALISRELSRMIQIPTNENILKRRLDTTPQKNLGMQDRKKNLENAFFIEENELQFRKVVLIDDIYTTGNTMDAAALALKGCGVSQVYGLCGGIGRNY